MSDDEKNAEALTTRINDVISRRIAARPGAMVVDARSLERERAGEIEAKQQMASETVVVGLNWVGDNVLALPTYRALHHR